MAAFRTHADAYFQGAGAVATFTDGTLDRKSVSDTMEFLLSLLRPGDADQLADLLGCKGAKSLSLEPRADPRRQIERRRLNGSGVALFSSAR